MQVSCFVRLLHIAGILLSVMGMMQGFSLQQKAVINPVDIVVFFGETLKVYCNLTTTDYNASQIYFKITAGSHITLIKDHIVVVDETSVYTEVDITEATHVGRTTYECKAGRDILKSILIYAEHPPQNVSNFQGVYHYNDKVILTWKQGVDYLISEKVVVEVDWNPHSPPNLSGNKCIVQMKEYCSIRYNGAEILFIRINVSSSQKRPSSEFISNALPASAISVHKFVLLDHMKTAPVSDFRVTSKTSRCFNITWKDPLYFDDFTHDTVYQILIKKGHELETEFETIVEDKVRPYSVRDDPVELCKLQPYTDHTLRLSVRAREKNPWSDPVELTAMTNEDRPAVGPLLTSTSYHTLDCYKNERKLFLYWNDPAQSSVHGELIKYEIKYGNKEVQLRPGNNYFQTMLDCNASYNISVYLATKVGVSVSPSMIHIPAKEDALQVPENFQFIVEEIFKSDISLSSKNVTFSWDSNQLEDKNVSLILYMCREGYKYYGRTCFNDFETVEVDISQNEITVSNIDIYVDLFGYALLNPAGNNRGIEWTDCVFRSELKPKKPVDVNVNTGSNSLLVTWTATRCNKKDKILILEYKLIACEGGPFDSQKKHCTEHVHDSKAGTVFELKNLHTDQRYYVYVQSVSYAGGGALSDPVVAFVPGTREESDLPVVDIIMSLLIGVICLGIITFFMSWVFLRCRQSKKHFENLMKVGSESLSGYSGYINYGFCIDEREEEHAIVAPPVPECLGDPAHGCFPVIREEDDTLPPAHVQPVIDSQDPTAISPEEDVMKSESNSINPNGYLKITNTGLTSPDSISSGNEERVSYSDFESVSETASDDDPHQMLLNQFLGTENPLRTSQISIDEGFSSPNTECTEIELQLFMNTHNSQVQPTNVNSNLFEFPSASSHQIPQVFSVVYDYDPHTEGQGAKITFDRHLPSHNTSSRDSDQNKFLFSSPPHSLSKLCSNADKERDPFRAPFAVSKIHDRQEDFSDFSSVSSDNQTIGDYARFGMDTDGHLSSFEERDDFREDDLVSLDHNNGEQPQSESSSICDACLDTPPNLKVSVYQDLNFIQNVENFMESSKTENGSAPDV